MAIEGTVIRVSGAGLIVQPHTKSSAGMRTIAVPGWVMEIFVRRYESAHGEWVFPSSAAARASRVPGARRPWSSGSTTSPTSPP